MTAFACHQFQCLQKWKHTFGFPSSKSACQLIPLEPRWAYCHSITVVTIKIKILLWNQAIGWPYKVQIVLQRNFVFDFVFKHLLPTVTYRKAYFNKLFNAIKGACNLHLIRLVLLLAFSQKFALKRLNQNFRFERASSYWTPVGSATIYEYARQIE